jgi:hypothetical protein
MTSGNGAIRGLSTDQLRQEVRAALRDVLPSLAGAPSPAPGGDVEVALGNDGDLDAFVRRVAGMCEDPSQRKALQDGRHRFRLATGEGRPPPAAEPSAPVVRVDNGAVTERLVGKAAADGARIVVGRRAVLTPLARDRARSLGVTIEKER